MSRSDLILDCICWSKDNGRRRFQHQLEVRLGSLRLISFGGWVIFCDRLTDGVRVGYCWAMAYLGPQVAHLGYMPPHFR